MKLLHAGCLSTVSKLVRDQAEAPERRYFSLTVPGLASDRKVALVELNRAAVIARGMVASSLIRARARFTVGFRICDAGAA